jgi:hypothetical protein
MEEQQGYSTLFYFMLAVGVLGMLGFVMVAIGGA